MQFSLHLQLVDFIYINYTFSLALTYHIVCNIYYYLLIAYKFLSNNLQFFKHLLQYYSFLYNSFNIYYYFPSI